jgi:hypothetical protein
VCFLLQINDLKPQCPCVKYVDDSTVWECCNYDGSDSQLQAAADQISEWSSQNHMSLNVSKTKEVLIWPGRRICDLACLEINGDHIERVSSFKLLGVMFSNSLKWDTHISYICAKAAKRIYFLRLLKRAGVNPEDILAVYTCLIRPILEYSCELWSNSLTGQQSDQVERIQKRVLKVLHYEHSYREALEKTGLKTLSQRRVAACRKLFEKIKQPDHCLHHLLPSPKTARHLRNSSQLPLPLCKTNRFKNSFINFGLFHYQ